MAVLVVRRDADRIATRIGGIVITAIVVESVLRALNDDESCADVLQRLSAARGAVNSLMAELMEDRIRNHMPRNSKSSEEAADDVIGDRADLSEITPSKNQALNPGPIRLSAHFSISSGHPIPLPGIESSEGEFSLGRTFSILVPLALFLYVPIARPQAGPVEDEHEVQIWTGGGHGTNGSQSSDGVWNLGLRYGLILTKPHAGFLRGRLEYAIDVVPTFVVIQKQNTAYGVGVNPFAFKWAFDTHGRVVPYFEIGGGTLFTNSQVPAGTSRINFTTSGALGLHFLRSKHNLSTEIRYMHISNAGLATPNPGINTVQLRLGFGRFSQKE